MKKITAILLTIVLLLATAVPTFAAVPEVAVPYYTNTSQARVSFVISDNGEASWTIMCIGKSSCTCIDAVTYLEYQVGNSWERVDLGNENDEYIYSTVASSIIQNNKITLTTPGTYRAVVVFTVYGTQENETLTYWNPHDFGI
jgi:hypothetical protein